MLPRGITTLLLSLFLLVQVTVCVWGEGWWQESTQWSTGSRERGRLDFGPRWCSKDVCLVPEPVCLSTSGRASTSFSEPLACPRLHGCRAPLTFIGSLDGSQRRHCATASHRLQRPRPIVRQQEWISPRSTSGIDGECSGFTQWRASHQGSLAMAPWGRGRAAFGAGFCHYEASRWCSAGSSRKHSGRCIPQASFRAFGGGRRALGGPVQDFCGPLADQWFGRTFGRFRRELQCFGSGYEPPRSGGLFASFFGRWYGCGFDKPLYQFRPRCQTKSSRSSTCGSRMDFFRAARRSSGILLSSRRGGPTTDGVPKRCPQAWASRWFYHARQGARRCKGRTKAPYGGGTGGSAGDCVGHFASTHRTAGSAYREAECAGEIPAACSRASGPLQGFGSGQNRDASVSIVAARLNSKSSGRAPLFAGASSSNKGSTSRGLAGPSYQVSGGRAFGSIATRRGVGCAVSHGDGTFGAKQGPTSLDGALPRQWLRSHVRPFLRSSHNGRQGHNGPRKAPAGVITGFWSLLFEGLPSYPSKNVPGIQATFKSFRSQRNFLAELPREVWGLWPESRAWYGAMVHRSRLRCRCKGRMGSRAGPPCTDSCHGGAGQLGQQSLALGMASQATGRSTSEFVDQQGPDSHGRKKAFLPAVFTGLGDNSTGLHEGGGGLADKATGDSGCKEPCRPGGSSCPKTCSKAKARQRQRPSGGSSSSKPRRGVSIATVGSCGGSSSPSDRCYLKPLRSQLPCSSSSSVPGCSPISAQNSVCGRGFNGACPTLGIQKDADQQSQKICQGELPFLNSGQRTDAEEILFRDESLDGFSFSFAEWCMSITRWALRSRTSFGNFLSTTLSLSRDGPLAPPTALFPLPLPVERPYAECPDGQIGCTVQKAALDRGLHVIICALNFMYWSRSCPPTDLIRRQPNEVQARAIQKLRLLLEACDRSEHIQVASSGRRNLQLMARLQELALAADNLGLMRRPYQEPASQAPVPIDNAAFPQLNPFSNLNPERLKITGRGQWRASDFIEPELYMPFLEPQILELAYPVFDRGVPNFGVDEPETVFDLFKKWDDLDLLVLHPCSEITTGGSGRVKIFNSFKSAANDRQIGDRRERNAWEGRIPGPSSALPVGPLIGRLVIPEGHGTKVCVTDRSDHYHQVKVTHARSRSNVVWPPMPLSKFVELKAYQKYCAAARASKKRRDRTVFGDDLGGHRPGVFSQEPTTQVYGGFGAILQGDHLGVEFGISAHVGLLQSEGLLPDRGRLVADALVRPCGLYQGLCIDDFFCIAPVLLEELHEGRTAPPSEAKKAFDVAKVCYQRQGLAGSDQKDVVDKVQGTVVGAEINSSQKLVSKGVLPVGAPSAKRLALSWIAAASARLPVTSDALHSSLIGGLVSIFCYRRCSMSILQEVFRVIPAEKLNTAAPVTRPLPRAAAEELILSSVLLPILVSDVKAPFHEWLYASDASNSKGAFCEAPISQNVLHPLWLSGDFKGARTHLDSEHKACFEDSTFWEEEDWQDFQAEDSLWPGVSSQSSPSRPLAQRYDFIEVCGGSGVVSDQVALLGYVVGPIIDLTYSEHFDLLDLRVVEWLIFMVQHRRIKAVALEPPCTTFSPAAYPPVRSYKMPRGFNQKSTKVWVGNRLAFACLTILLVAAHCLVLALLETPRRSKMAWLEEWKRLLQLPNVEETFTASCSFGSPFQKEFRFLVANMRASSLCRPCTRDHSHVRIQGQLTKGSAVYCPGLAKAIASLFAKHLEVERAYSQKHALKCDGLESVFVNELVKTSSWEVGGAWKWTGSSHINILETSSALRTVKAAALRGGGRTALLLDSNVAVRAIAKGRSSARALGALLRKIACVSIAFSVFLSVLFCPTRLNCADDPTRSVPLRFRCEGQSFLQALDFDGLFNLAELPRQRRWISNWASLFLGLCSHHALRLGSLQCFHPRFRSPLPPVDFYHHILDFDSTLGYPGEGPISHVGSAQVFLLICFVVCSHGMLPRNGDDVKRAERRLAVPLFPGRPVRHATRTNREKLLDRFREWLKAKGFSLDVLLSAAYAEPESLVTHLVDFGKEQYEAGYPYNHFAETFNAIGAAKPTVRRFLTAAWDLAFSWVRQEPGEHHTACPFQILLALLSTAIYWGWPAVAGAVALSWGAVCRIGEVLQAVRRDLVIPADVMFSSTVVYLKVQEPKTRFKAARHQMSRLDYQDLVQLVSCAFGHLEADKKLWPFSGQLMRTRFRQLLAAVGLPTKAQGQERPLDLGSLRAGGATHLLMITEDSELVRRRGRWLAHRTMEIYLQEIGATVMFPSLPVGVKTKVMQLAYAFPGLLEKMRRFTAAGIPETAWYHLLRSEQTGKMGTMPRAASAKHADARENDAQKAEWKRRRATGISCEALFERACAQAALPSFASHPGYNT